MDVTGLIIIGCCKLLFGGIVGPVHAPTVGYTGGELFIMICANGGNSVAEFCPPVVWNDVGVTNDGERLKIWLDGGAVE